MNPLMRGGNETFEQRVRHMRLAQKFRVELAGNEKRVVRDLNDFHQLAVRGQPAEGKAGLLEFFAVGIVEFVTMTVTFVDDE